MSSSTDIIEHYRNLLEISQRDGHKFMQMVMNLNDVIVTLKDTIKHLQEDNEHLRTQLTIIQNRYFEQLFNIETNELNINPEPEIIHDIEPIPAISIETVYSIPPHVRNVYLRNLSDNQVCSICLSNIESINTTELTECGHIFHTNCLNIHRENNNNCPVCRRTL